MGWDDEVGDEEVAEVMARLLGDGLFAPPPPPEQPGVRSIRPPAERSLARMPYLWVVRSALRLTRGRDGREMRCQVLPYQATLAPGRGPDQGGPK